MEELLVKGLPCFQSYLLYTSSLDVNSLLTKAGIDAVNIH